MNRLLRTAANTISGFGLAGRIHAARRRKSGVNRTRTAVDEMLLAIEALDLWTSTGVMVDVGAHYGTTSLPFCRAGWRVLAFEPDSENRAMLIDRLRGFRKVSIDVRALADREQDDVAFYRSKQSSGISGLSAFHTSHEKAGTVMTTTLSRALVEYQVDRVDVLKIDTEGFDKAVLDGFPWDQPLPRLIMTEFEDRKTAPRGYRYTDLVELLVSRGYQVLVSEWKPVVEYGGSHEWVNYHVAPCRLDNAQGWGNLLALSDPADFDRVCGRFADMTAAFSERVQTGGGQ